MIVNTSELDNAKERAFLKEIKYALSHLMEYLSVIEDYGYNNIEEEIKFLKDNFKFLDHKTSSFLNHRIYNARNFKIRKSKQE